MRRPRNPVVRKMISRNQKGGYHKNKIFDRNKYLARAPITEEEIEPTHHERELPTICIFPNCYEEYEYVSPADLCSEHWNQWWNDGLEEINEEFWEELLKQG